MVMLYAMVMLEPSQEVRYADVTGRRQLCSLWKLLLHCVVVTKLALNRLLRLHSACDGAVREVSMNALVK